MLLKNLYLLNWSFFLILVPNILSFIVLVKVSVILSSYLMGQENFSSSRKNSSENPQSANPAMFLATPYDKKSEAWTRSSPTPTVSSS